MSLEEPLSNEIRWSCFLSIVSGSTSYLTCQVPQTHGEQMWEEEQFFIPESAFNFLCRVGAHYVLLQSRSPLAVGRCSASTF